MSRLLSPAVFALVLGFTARVQAAPIGPSPIVNGTATTEYPQVVAILLDGERHCTGTLVTRRIVATAGHCVVGRGKLSVYFGAGLDAEEPGTTIAVADARPHPGYDPTTLTNDIGVVLLEHEAPYPPIAIFGGFWDPSFVGRPVELVGFGAISGDTSGPHLKRVGMARLTGYDATSLTFTGDPARTCSGDSGGPAFMRLDGDLVLIGITSSGDRACTKDPTDTRADAFMAGFIGPYVAAQSRMDRSIGEQCRSDEQCIEHRCTDASLATSATYCSRSCVRNDQCPGAMVCDRGGELCVYEDGGPASDGALCELPEDCASGICALLEPDGERQCASWCATALPEICSDDTVCVENQASVGTYVCGAISPLTAGCASVSPWTPATPVLLLILVIAWHLVPSRARGAASRLHRPDDSSRG